MPYKVMKPCKVCGKMYTPCFDCENDKTSFHWRAVACSYECGQKYLAAVMEARSDKKEAYADTENPSINDSIEKNGPTDQVDKKAEKDSASVQSKKKTSRNIKEREKIE